MCGKPPDESPTGTVLCAGCRARYREYRCVVCDQPGIYLAEVEADRPHLAAGVCGLCFIRRWVAELSESDKAAIREATAGGTLPAVRLMREMLGWGINDAVVAVRVLTGKT